MIDWVGNMNNVAAKKHPSIGEMSEFFSTLYEPIDYDGDVNNLESNTYIPITDEPITIDELATASKQTKTGGFDYPLGILRLLVSEIPAVMFCLI